MNGRVKKLGKKLATKLLHDMVLMRRFEEKAGQMYGLKKIGGFCHLYIGQEASAAGSIGALDMKKDYILGAYRDHAYALAAGMTPREIMAELYGKATGCSKGKGGSMHMYSNEKHMFGGNGIVGGQIPVATGVALKIRYMEEDGVVICYFGDGAIHQGAFHESLNLASIHKLPIIYVCENNQYGMGTDFRRVSSVDDFSIMAASYGMEGLQVNGMDVGEVYETFSRTVDEIRHNPSPKLFEVKTYRYRGHSMSDPAKYRTKEELEGYKNQDPILIFLEAMKKEDFITDSAYEKMDKDIKEICEDAVAFAEDSPQPALDELYTDVFAQV
ncbi:MAG: pyruvate dehydrogenase (acetyl-transferring) E1 component subunit alpha [Spirochaetales bacterium]|nr:pyruvate dehydrogenase (acetyl-transferring) E1 component subunit alpha [Spirochaetales bacterium]